jgi:mannose-6-phosphate isomerase-like protein (cupin superfamily)
MPEASSTFRTASAAELLARLPGRVSAQWPQGERFVQALAHGSMSVELYAPTGTDPQSPHQLDELYFVISGTGDFVCGQERTRFAPNTVLFAPAGEVHRFENFSADFTSWAVFWGPSGGES